MGCQGRKREIKFSERFEEDWKFYIKHCDKFSFCGTEVSPPLFDEEGVTGKECFYGFDSTGKLKPCCEPDLVRKVLICKKSINFHIKIWAEGYQDVCIPVNELLEEFEDPPEWIEKSLRNQIYKVFKNLYNTGGDP